MPPTDREHHDIPQLATALLRDQNIPIASSEPLQTLWAGYGHVFRLTTRADPDPKFHPNPGPDPTDPPRAPPRHLILKYVSPPPPPPFPHDDGHGVGGSGIPSAHESHLRKLLSYRVEQSFYRLLAPLLPPQIAVARCFHASSGTPEPVTSDGKGGGGERGGGTEGAMALVLEDLSQRFPGTGEGRRGVLGQVQVQAALRWLAGFHGFWWGRGVVGVGGEGGGGGNGGREGLRRPPLEEVRMQRERERGEEDGVWLNGGYTYLATRRTEYASLQNDPSSEWSAALCSPVSARGRTGSEDESLAELVARVLSPPASPSSSAGAFPADFETLIHGDVKSENLFTSAPAPPEGETEGETAAVAAAFFDFQYVGLGLGVCDLAKLCTCSVPLAMLLAPSSSSLSSTAAAADECVEAGEDGQSILGRECDMQPGERQLLETYRHAIERASGKSYPWHALELHWKTALVDWLRFQASWGFWGNTEWLEARVRCILRDEAWWEWILQRTSEKTT